MRILLAFVLVVVAMPAAACDRAVSTGLISALLDRDPNRFYVLSESPTEILVSMDRKFWAEQSEGFRSGFAFSYGCALRGKRTKVTIIER